MNTIADVWGMRRGGDGLGLFEPGLVLVGRCCWRPLACQVQTSSIKKNPTLAFSGYHTGTALYLQ